MPQHARIQGTCLLPAELLCMIFEALCRRGELVTLARCARVCVRMKPLVEPFLYRAVYLRATQTALAFRRSLRGKTALGLHVRTLKLPAEWAHFREGKSDGEVLVSLFRLCPKLTAIHLSMLDLFTVERMGFLDHLTVNRILLHGSRSGVHAICEHLPWLASELEELHVDRLDLTLDLGLHRDHYLVTLTNLQFFSASVDVTKGGTCHWPDVWTHGALVRILRRLHNLPSLVEARLFFYPKDSWRHLTGGPLEECWLSLMDPRIQLVACDLRDDVYQRMVFNDMCGDGSMWTAGRPLMYYSRGRHFSVVPDLPPRSEPLHGQS